MTSEARTTANKANAAKSTGPKTPEGKAQSRRNALKHGLTGEGIVLPNEDAAEVDRRFTAFVDELKPSGEVAWTLARRAAVLSVRMDRCVSQETASLSERVRQAEADFFAPEGLDPLEADRLRAEAGARAMFDPSKEATLARKYEAAAERGFFRSLKELRLLDKQEQASAPANEPEMNEAAFRAMMGSFGQLDKEAAHWESMYPETELPTPMQPSRASAGARNRADFATAEVPFSIGRAQ